MRPHYLSTRPAKKDRSKLKKIKQGGQSPNQNQNLIDQFRNPIILSRKINLKMKLRTLNLRKILVKA